MDEELIPCVTDENIIFYIGVLGIEYFFLKKKNSYNLLAHHKTLNSKFHPLQSLSF